MFKKLFSFAILSALTLLASAQIVDPVKWTLDVNADDDHSGTLVWTATIQSGYHIYGMEKVPDGPIPTTISVDDVPGLTWEGALTPSRPAAKYTDRMFALDLHEWSGTVSFSRRYRLESGSTGVTVNSTVHFMACTDRACLSPKTVELQATIGTPSTQANTDTVEPTASARMNEQASVTVADSTGWWAPVTLPEGAKSPTSTADRSMWMLLLLGFGGGLLALLTPCVWPMIPMTLSFFLKKSKSRARSVGDALLYGFSIIVIFLALGLAITAIFGASKLNDLATSAVFNLIFFAILVLFAISFFGAFDIKLPSKWSNAVDNKAATTSGLLSIFFMAFTLVLVSFSCTGPIIGTLLVEAAAKDSIAGPAAGMGGFALGLAVPFTLFAFFPSLLKEMPKAGGWMNSVKVVLGFIELILALKFLSVADLAYGWRILDREVFLSLWIVLFALLGMYLLGKLRFSHDSPSGHSSVLGFFLATVSFSFAVYLVPGLWGAPLKAISAFAPPLTTQDFNLYGGQFKEFDDFDKGMAYAAENNRPVLVDFSGYGCVNCRKMEGAVFDTEKVRSIVEKDYVLIKLMVDDKAKLEKPITVDFNGRKKTLKTVGDKWSFLQEYKFNINSQPYYVILGNDGQLLEEPRMYDENVGAFVDWLKNGLTTYQESVTLNP